MNVPDDLMERIYATMQYYANLTTYQAPRIGGILAGCPRGAKPTPEKLVHEAQNIVEQMDAALRPPASAEGKGELVAIPRGSKAWLHAAVRDACLRVEKNLGETFRAPKELMFAPILFAMQDAIKALPPPPEK